MATTDMEEERVKYVACMVVVLGALLATGSASAKTDAGTLSVSTRYYNTFVRVNARYTVFDARGHCTTDEDGYYYDEACDDYDSNDAELEIRVFGGRNGRQLIYSDNAYGFSGRASFTVYASLDLNEPYCGYGSRKWTRNYVAIVHVFDPVNGSVAATKTFRFWSRCR
jgi:hypothetical protein